MKMKTVQLVMCSIFAALSAVLSQISINIGPVPVNFTHVSIFLAAGLLGAKYGTLSQIVFVIAGAIGIPVFSGFAGGIGVIANATGGFIIGYILCAFVTGLVIDHFGTSLKVQLPAMYLGWLVTYALGIPWFMIVTGTDFVTSLTWCMLPFLPTDAVKTVLSAILINRLKPALAKTSWTAK